MALFWAVNITASLVTWEMRTKGYKEESMISNKSAEMVEMSLACFTNGCRTASRSIIVPTCSDFSFLIGQLLTV